MSPARYYFWSHATDTHSRDPLLSPRIEIPRGSDTKIALRYYKLSGQDSVINPAGRVYNDPKLVARSLVLITLSDYKKSSERGYYTRFMAEQLSEIGVPAHVQPAILEKLFGVIDVTVPGRHILVLLGDLTFDLLDNATNCSARLNGSFTNDQQIMFQRLTMEPRCDVPKVKVVASFIQHLEKVRLDRLDAAVRQMPCSICMEGFDHFGAAKEGNDHQQLIARLPCFHIYHEGCIVQWLENDQTCPLCRSPVVKFHEASKPPLRMHWPVLMMSAVGMLTMLIPKLLN